MEKKEQKEQKEPIVVTHEQIIGDKKSCCAFYMIAEERFAQEIHFSKCKSDGSTQYGGNLYQITTVMCSSKCRECDKPKCSCRRNECITSALWALDDACDCWRRDKIDEDLLMFAKDSIKRFNQLSGFTKEELLEKAKNLNARTKKLRESNN